MKVLVDENLAPKWAHFLKPHGIDADHWIGIGKMGATDDVVWDVAVSQGYVVLSKDLDFSRMLAQRNTPLPSVIQLRVDDPNPEIWGKTLIHVLKVHADQIYSGCLISIKPDQHRIRILPIHRK